MKFRILAVTVFAAGMALASATAAPAASPGPLGPVSVVGEGPLAVPNELPGPAGATTQSVTGSGPIGPAGSPVESTPVTGQEAPMFDGGSLTMLYGRTGAQMLSVLLQSKEGGLVVVDGGWEGDADTLLDAIRARGGRVHAWLITHPDFDHAGALYNIIDRQDPGIVIDHIYACLTDTGWYYQVAPDGAPFVDMFRQRLARLPEGTVSEYLPANLLISSPGIGIKVLNNAIFGADDAVNNSSVVYRVTMNGIRILFLGDLARYGGSRLLQDVPPEELRADIVQMAHHGQNGVEEDVYRAIGASVCLWPTPQWLWDNDGGSGTGSGSWRTLETRAWIRKLGITRNYVMKDGDIILR